MSFQINRRRGPLTAPAPKPEYVGCHGSSTPHRWFLGENTHGGIVTGVCLNCFAEKPFKNFMAEGDATMPYLAPHERAMFGKGDWNG